MVEGIPLDFEGTLGHSREFRRLLYEVLIRFGRWDDILAAPDHPNFMPLTRAMGFAARGIALAAKGDVAAAKLEQESIKKWVLKPHCGLGSRVKQPCIPRIGDWFPRAPVGANLGKTLSAG